MEGRVARRVGFVGALALTSTLVAGCSVGASEAPTTIPAESPTPAPSIVDDGHTLVGSDSDFYITKLNSYNFEYLITRGPGSYAITPDSVPMGEAERYLRGRGCELDLIQQAKSGEMVLIGGVTDCLPEIK